MQWKRRGRESQEGRTFQSSIEIIIIATITDTSIIIIIIIVMCFNNSFHIIHWDIIISLHRKPSVRHYLQCIHLTNLPTAVPADGSLMDALLKSMFFCNHGS
jgi:hypothetical protein